MKAFLFPGQGCQKEGMGKDLYEKFPKAKAIFEEANDILGERFSDTLFSASELLLTDTRYTQPAIFIYEVALAMAQDEVRPDCVAGHSLGEYAAMVVAGALSFEEALRTRTFEPDMPNYTPRISGLVEIADGNAAFRFSILKSDRGNPDVVIRQFFEYSTMPKGEGAFIHTYRCDGNPIPSFEGEPERVSVLGDLATWTKEVWDSLDADNRISLFTCELPVDGSKGQECVINKYQ